MNARTFGTDDKQAEFFARYGVRSYAELGHKLAAANAEPRNQRAAEDFRPSSLAPAPAVRLASEKSVEFMVSLWLERSNKATAEQVRAWGSQQDQATVSAKIDWLKTQPRLWSKVEKTPEVPAGRYAITGENGQTVFLKVSVSKNGRTFVAIQAGSDYHTTAWPVAKALLAKIAEAGLDAAMIRYGRELGVCGRCGRELTDEESRAAGIGPVCRAK